MSRRAACAVGRSGDASACRCIVVAVDILIIVMPPDNNREHALQPIYSDVFWLALFLRLLPWFGMRSLLLQLRRGQIHVNGQSVTHQVLVKLLDLDTPALVLLSEIGMVRYVPLFRQHHWLVVWI